MIRFSLCYTRYFDVLKCWRLLQEVDTSYYKRLINEVPPGLVSVPIIVHCLVEQVAAYAWPLEDIKALEVANENRRFLLAMDEAFKKLGHPKWMGVDRDVDSNLAKRFEMLYNFSQKDAAQSVVLNSNDQLNSLTNGKNSEGLPAPESDTQGEVVLTLKTAKDNVSTMSEGTGKDSKEKSSVKAEAVKPKSGRGSPAKEEAGGGKKSKKGGTSPSLKEDIHSVSDINFPPENGENPSGLKLSEDMHISATCGECTSHAAITGTCGVHHEHVDMGDEIELRKAGTPEIPYNPYLKPADLDERLNVTHEFDTVTRLLLKLKPQKPQFMNSVDVMKVEGHLSKIRATPGNSLNNLQ